GRLRSADRGGALGLARRGMTFSPAVTAELAAAGLDPADIHRLISTALAEDLRYGPDATTTATVPADAVAVAEPTPRTEGVIAGTGCAIRDSRKTLPGLRLAQKYAVRQGGGVNHRLGLGDAVLIKDNHVIAAGSITAALAAVRAHAPELPCEVEVDTLAELDE